MHSLVAQRIIYDHLRVVGGVLNVPITKKLLTAAASSQQKYEKYECPFICTNLSILIVLNLQSI